MYTRIPRLYMLGLQPSVLPCVDVLYTTCFATIAAYKCTAGHGLMLDPGSEQCRQEDRDVWLLYYTLNR